jgi:hypothetical protein
MRSRQLAQTRSYSGIRKDSRCLKYRVSQFLWPDERSAQPSAVFVASWGFSRIERAGGRELLQQKEVADFSDFNQVSWMYINMEFVYILC